MKMILPLLLPLVLFFGGCKKKEPVDGAKSTEATTAPESKLEEAKVNISTDSLADSIVGKMITVVVSERMRLRMRFNANGVMLVAEQDGNLEDRGLTYKIKGNEVLVFEDGERDGGILFSSSSPKVGDQIEMGSEDDKQKITIIKIEAADEIEKPPTADELLDSMGTPLNEFEKIIADKKYLEKFVINTTDPNLYNGVAPAETINRTNRTYSILYTVDGVKNLVHGIWMIKGNNLFYMELVSDGTQIPKEEREVYEATIITLDKEKSLFSLPSFEENLKEERITWELIEKFTSVEMQKFNDEVTNKNFDIFKNNTVDKKSSTKASIIEKPVTETNPKLKGVSVEELEPRERLVYVKGSDVPYTGKSYELYPNGKLEEVTTFKDGIPNGLMTKWYMNGQKEAEVNFKDGKPDGLVVEWWETGEKMSEVTFKDGKPVDGSEKSFDRQEFTKEEIERAEEFNKE